MYDCIIKLVCSKPRENIKRKLGSFELKCPDLFKIEFDQRKNVVILTNAKCFGEYLQEDETYTQA